MLKQILLIGISAFLFACEQHTEYFFETEDVNGLAKGSAVRVSGLEIGEIRDIALLNNGHILCKIKTQPDIKIPKNSKINIKASGVMSGKIVEIEMTNNRTYYAPGDTIPAEDVVFVGLTKSLFENDPETKQKVDSVVNIIGRALVDIADVILEDSLKLDSIEKNNH